MARGVSGDGVVGLAEAAGVVGVGGHAFEAVEDEVLKGLDVGGFAADADGGDAAGAGVGLFALVTEQGEGSFLCFKRYLDLYIF